MNASSSDLIQWLLKNRLGLIQAWVRPLGPDDQFMLFKAAGAASDCVGAYLDEVIAILSSAHVKVPPLPRPRPDDVLCEISVLLNGRRILFDFLGQENSLAPDKQVVFLQALNDAFRELLRRNSSSACDCCRWALDEEEKDIRSLCEELTGKNCCDHVEPGARQNLETIRQ